MNIIYLSIAQDCLTPADSQGKPIPFKDNNTAPRLPSGSQAIITSYQFQCCGNITAWQTYVHPGGRRHRTEGSNIEFQVWRPSPTVNKDGCYDLVGKNVFLNTTLQDHSGLFSKIIKPSDTISVRPGDVVGYYYKDSRCIQGIQLDENYQDESVWHKISDENGDQAHSGNEKKICPFPVGSTGLLSSSTNAAPVLSINLGIVNMDLAILIMHAVHPHTILSSYG